MQKAVATFICAFFLTLAGIAADYYVLGASGSGTEFLTINEHSVCNSVGNASAQTIFIPTRTAGEWANFRTYPPSGVTVSTCCGKVC